MMRVIRHGGHTVLPDAGRGGGRFRNHGQVNLFGFVSTANQCSYSQQQSEQASHISHAGADSDRSQELPLKMYQRRYHKIMPRLKNTERELLARTIAMLTRKAKDRTFAATILQGVLDDTNRLTIEGRLKVSQTAAARHAKEQSPVVAMKPQKKAA